MGVDYEQCDICKECLYEEYVIRCDSCNHNLCSSCIINNDKPEEIYMHAFANEDGEFDTKYCPFCNKNVVSDETLLEYILKKYNLDKQKEIDSFRGKGESTE